MTYILYLLSLRPHTGAHIAGRLNPDLNPEDRAKSPQFILQMWGKEQSPDFPVEPGV
jgi:hypothetical protein